VSPRLLATLTLVLSLAAPVVAFAKDSAMVAEFTGKQHGQIRDRVVKALKKAGVSVTGGAGAAPQDEAARKSVAKKKKVALFVEGNIEVSKKGDWTLEIWSNGVGSAGEGRLSLDGKSVAALNKKIDAEVAPFVKERLLEAKDGSKASADEKAKEEKAKEEKAKEEKAKEEEEKEKEQKAKEEDEAEDREKEKAEEDKEEEKEKEDAGKKPEGRRPSPFSLGLHFRVFNRHYWYNQDVNQNLRPYDLDAAPSFFVSLGWYPVAHFSSGPAANIGIVGDFEQSIGAKSEDERGVKHSTSMQAFSAGLRGRLPFGENEAGFSVRYGRHAFDVKDDRDPTAASAQGAPLTRDLIPGVAYSFIEPALDARFAFGSFGLGALIGYRLVLSAGEIQDPVWFPNATAGALHANVFFSYALARPLHAVLGVDVRRFGLSMHSKPADVPAGKDVAGGAIDQYLAAFIGIEYRLPGD
jgi:hypothetical protein